MADFVRVPESDWKDILDATREKTGGTEKMLSGEVATAVRGIEGETIIRDAYSEYDDVCFYDYDGTLLYSCTLAEAQAMTKLPNIPDHSGDKVPLVSQGWNYTLEEVNALNRKADIGAIYNPVDGKTHFTLRLNSKTGLTCTTQFYMYAGGTMYADWGDGTVDTNATATSYSAYLTHTYAETGEYDVTIWCEGSTWTPYKQCICNEAPEAVVGTFVLGTDISCWWLGAFLTHALNSTSVEYIVWPNLYEEGKDFSSSSGDSIVNTPYLKHFNVPRGVVSGVPSFKNACLLKRASVPESAVSSMDYFCAGCYSMDRLCLPYGWINNFTGTTNNRFLLENYPGEEWTYHFAPNYRDLYMAYGLRKLTVCDNVTSVSGNMWCQNSPLEDVYLYPTTPPTLSATGNMFTKIRKNAIIHVPAASLEAYKTATNWSTWADYMVGDL